jgi:hypothetical protein
MIGLDAVDRECKMKLNVDDIPNVPRYCRQLMKKGNYPKTLELYREEMLCLTVDVVRASKLRLVENEKRGPLYEKHRENSFLKGAEAVYV